MKSTKSNLIKLLAATAFSFVLGACGGGGTDSAPASNTSTSSSTSATTSSATTSSSTRSTSSSTASTTTGNSTTSSSVSLSWLPPTTYSDGTSLTDLAGHHIYQKLDSGSYERIHTINTAGLTEYLVEDLTPGDYTFAITAFNDAGTESIYSTSGITVL